MIERSERQLSTKLKPSHWLNQKESKRTEKGTLSSLCGQGYLVLRIIQTHLPYHAALGDTPTMTPLGLPSDPMTNLGKNSA